MTLLAVAVSGRGLVDPDEPVVFADDEGFLRGRGAFETMRVYGGRPFRLDEHLARLPGFRRPARPAAARRGRDRGARRAGSRGGRQPTTRSSAFTRRPGREGSGRPVLLALVGSLPPDLEELRARGLRLVSVPLGLDAPARGRSAA